MTAIEKVFSTITEFTKTMGNLHGDFLKVVRRDIDRFKEMTDSLNSQMQWQGWTTIALNSVSASLAVAGTLIPKAGAAPILDTRLSVNEGIADPLTSILKTLSDSEFLRSTSKTGAKFFGGIAPAADSWHRSKTTKIEADREITRMSFQEAQGEKSRFDQAATRAQEAVQSILNQKARGG